MLKQKLAAQQKQFQDIERKRLSRKVRELADRTAIGFPRPLPPPLSD